MNKSPGPDSDWQTLWFSTRQKAWSSLAIVPSDEGVDVGRVAARLVTTGKLRAERPLDFVNARGLHLNDIQPLIDTLLKMTERGQWVIVTVNPLLQNPSAVPIARATSHALLVVQLGVSRMSSARVAIKALGRERLLGSVVLDQRFDRG